MRNSAAARLSKAAALHYAESLRDIVQPIAHLPTREIARRLNQERFFTSRGGPWSSMAVSRLLKLLELRK